MTVCLPETMLNAAERVLLLVVSHSFHLLSKLEHELLESLYVCIGFPAQERWLEANFSKLQNIKLALALGGSVDVWAGRVRRAPKLFIKLGVEWLWRLLRQPSRLGRMMKLPKFYFGTKKYKKQIDRQK